MEEKRNVLSNAQKEWAQIKKNKKRYDRLAVEFAAEEVPSDELLSSMTERMKSSRAASLMQKISVLVSFNCYIYHMHSFHYVCALLILIL